MCDRGPVGCLRCPTLFGSCHAAHEITPLAFNAAAPSAPAQPTSPPDSFSQPTEGVTKMQAALCNTRVFTARTQTRSASRRSVRVQAADRTLWLPGKARQEPCCHRTQRTQLASSPVRPERPSLPSTRQ